MLENDVCYWVQSCATTLQENSCFENIDTPIQEEESMMLDSSDDEKENIVVENVNGKTKVDFVEPEDDHYSICTDQTVPFTVKPDYVQYWKWDSSKMENRFQLQRFQHHILTQEKMSQNYTYTINTICPPSPKESEIHNNAFMLSKELRLNAVQFRYKRVANNCREVMCRLCISERWIPQSMFGDHMAITHGILNTETYGLIALPPPAALYKQQIGKLKFYYVKCSKCVTWIRLGKLAGVNHIDPELEVKENVGSFVQSPFKVGLYSNYFVHFTQCADLYGK